MEGAEVFARELGDVPGGRGAVPEVAVEPAEVVRQEPAAVRHHDLQVGEMLEHTFEDQGRHHFAFLDRLTDRIPEGVLLEPRVLHAVRVNERNDAELAELFPEWAERRRAKVDAVHVRGQVRDAESQLLNGAAGLADRELEVAERQSERSDEASRVELAQICDRVVDAALELELLSWFSPARVLHDGRRREHLHVDTGLIHVCQA